ncbi:Class II abasic (AP) endonuclease [Cryptotrichosporon argae]
MRILSWNVNVLRTCLDYHPFSAMKKRNVEGLLDELGAEIACFQEHKTRRTQLDKPTACPGAYDAFYTFPRSRTGYAGVCTYVDARAAVPLRAEEGITGTLLADPRGPMRPPWAPDERVGSYPNWNAVEWETTDDGAPFDARSLDMEGRAVVLDFGLFVLFNLYCPNETNDARRPYKMNFLTALQLRVGALHAAGRNVIIVGDLNTMRAPIDSGEGGIRSSAEQHYAHPARGRLDAWCRDPDGVVDVTRECWPDREGMFTCWNLKLDARPSNYGSRIDYVLVSPALRPWVAHADILPNVYGSDHCPVYVDLHETIPDPAEPGRTLVLRDLMDPPGRPACTAPVFGERQDRAGRPEPPRFATRHWDEFSGRQRTLMGLWGAGKQKKDSGLEGGAVGLGKSTGSAGKPVSEDAVDAADGGISTADNDVRGVVANSAEPPTGMADEALPLSLARAAFSSLDRGSPPASTSQTPPMQASMPTPAPSYTQATSTAASQPVVPLAGPSPIRSPLTAISPAPAAPASKRASTSAAIDLTADSPPPRKAKPLPAVKGARDKGKAKETGTAQPSLASFWGASKAKPASPSQSPAARQRSASAVAASPRAAELGAEPSPVSVAVAVEADDPDPPGPPATADQDADAAYAQAIADAETEAEAARESRKTEAAPVWAHVFAKKKVPVCTVHQRACKDYIVKIQGPNKGKRFWLCSMPVGPGYDTGRSKRPRDEVNHEYRCDFFLWDSATKRETAK